MNYSPPNPANGLRVIHLSNNTRLFLRLEYHKTMLQDVMVRDEWTVPCGEPDCEGSISHATLRSDMACPGAEGEEEHLHLLLLLSEKILLRVIHEIRPFVHEILPQIDELFLTSCDPMLE